MFGFDERFTMFDITPLENQFILEYLPEARGDYVKVYLYGLLRCYHPEKDMNLDTMSHELNLSEDDVLAAFRFWERKKLVRRISDKPPRWVYINIKQISLSPVDAVDPEYAEFCDAVCDAFDKVRRLHGSEMNTCFEWHEDLKLPTEVIVMLLNHMVEIKGRNFRIADAGKVALRMAEEGICTAEAAEEYFLRNGQTYKNLKEVLKKLGKSYTPSEAQMNMYLKWIREWHFTHEAILEAVEKTAKGDPSMGYLDGILNSIRLDTGDMDPITPDRLHQSDRRTNAFREVVSALGKGEVSQRNLQLYDQMCLLYPQDIILIAAEECRKTGMDLRDVLSLLQSWKEKDLNTKRDVETYVRSFHDQGTLIRELRGIWGDPEKRIGSADRKLVSKWEGEYGFSRDMIREVAVYAAEAKAPMAYLDKILTSYLEKGILTPEEVRKDREKNGTASSAKKKVRANTAQDYEQRDYTGVQEQMMEAQRRRMEEHMQRNGGDRHA